MATLTAGEAGRPPVSLRRRALIELIERHGALKVTDLAERLRVSTMTIRRDLAHLAAGRQVLRDHGGATAIALAPRLDPEEPTFEVRCRSNAAAKFAIARAAAVLVKPGETIGLDTGSTTHRFAEVLRSQPGLRIFASNLRTATMLAGGASPVYALGGLIRPQELSAHGPVTSGQLATLWLDVVFIGVSGLSEHGLFDYSLEDSEIKRAFIQRAERVVVLCDAEKFGRRSLTLVAPLERIDVLVTDRVPPDALAAALQRGGVRVIVAASEAVSAAGMPPFGVSAAT